MLIEIKPIPRWLMTTLIVLVIIALTVAQALLALKGHAAAALAWLLGVLAFLIVTVAVSGITGLEMQVELGFLIGASVST